VIPLRRSIVPFTLALLVTAAAAAAPAAVRLEAIIPADTDMVLVIDDVPRFLERWSESPLGRAWNDPQMKRFLAPMRDDMEIDRWEEIVRGETGLELDEILGAFTGQVALLLPDMQQIVEAAEGEEAEQVAMLAEVGENEQIIRQLLELDLDSSRDELEENEKLEEVEEEFEGETLHVRRLTNADGEEEGEGWAIVEGFAVMAEPKSYLQQIVGAVKERTSDAPLKDSPGFRKVRGRVPTTDLLVYFDFGAVLPVIEEALKNDLEDPEAPNPMGLTGQALLDALAFDAIQSIFVSTTMMEGATHIDVGLQYTEDRGLMKILAFEPGPVQLPDFLPDDAVEASAANFSLPKMWQALKEILGALNPAFSGMLDMQLAQLNATHGFDLEKGVFGSLGDRFVAAKYLRPAEEPGETPSLDVLDQIFGISVTDRQSLEMGLEALKSMAGAGAELFEVTEYLDHTIFTLKQEMPSEPGAPAQRLAYTLTDDYLLLSTGTQAPLRAAVSHGGRPGKNLWDRKEVKRAMKALPPNASGLSFYDVERMLRSAIEGCGRVQSLMQPDAEPVEAEGGPEEDADAVEEEAGPEFCDPEAKPDPSTIGKYFGPAVGAQYKDGGGFYSTVRLIHPSD
jgi:hypothetical protein